MWCAAGSSGRNICLATRRSPSRRLPMAADFRTRSICPACRSEEHTSELQSLMRISYAVFCLKKKNKKNHTYQLTTGISRNEEHVNHKKLKNTIENTTRTPKQCKLNTRNSQAQLS